METNNPPVTKKKMNTTVTRYDTAFYVQALDRFVATGECAETDTEPLYAYLLSVMNESIMQSMNANSTRAKVIAAQECNTSLNAGNFDMATRGGFTEKTWHVTYIPAARDTHKGLNGKTVGLGEAFVTSKGNRLMMPCDPDCMAAEETVNCHCYLTYS